MAKKTVNAREILKDIKAGMDNTALIRKYQLSEKGLHSVFKKLVDSGALKQEDLDSRLASHDGPPPASKPKNSGAPELHVCPKCGKEYDDTSTKFCPQDGFRLVPKNSGGTCPKGLSTNRCCNLTSRFV